MRSLADRARSSSGIVSVVAALTLLPAVLSLLGDRIDALRIPYFGRAAPSAAARAAFWGGIVARRDAAARWSASSRRSRSCSRPPCPCSRWTVGAAGISTLPDRFAVEAGLPRSSSGSSRPPDDRPGARSSSTGDTASETCAARSSGSQAELGADDDVRPGDDGGEPGRRRSSSSRVPVGGRRRSRPRRSAAVRELRGRPRAGRLRRRRAPRRSSAARPPRTSTTSTSWTPGCRSCSSFVLGLQLRPAHDRVPLDRRRRRRRSPSTCSRSAPPTACSCSSSSEGVGNELFGFQQVDTIEAWVPLFLFAVLFGLSMDYQVFLLSRIRERYSQTGDNDDAISFGVGSTARLITGAALIIVAVFAGFAARRPRHVPADGLRGRGRAAHRRDDRPLGARAGGDEAARRAGTGTCRAGSRGCPTSTSRGTKRSSSRAALPDDRRGRPRDLGGGGLRRGADRDPARPADPRPRRRRLRALGARGTGPGTTGR